MQPTTATTWIRRRLFIRRRKVYACRRQHSSTVDYRTKGGTVEGVWMFCRHGDRTPSRPLCPKHRRDQEADFWLTKLPYPDPFSAFQELSKVYPPDIHPSNEGSFLDVKRYPYGFLTHHGIEELEKSGRTLFHRYNQMGHHHPNHAQYQNADGFLDVWDVTVYSTNYVRTIMSAQSFLDGLLDTQCYRERPAKTFKPNYRYPDPAELEYAHWLEGCSSSRENAKVTVQVRDRAADTLNAFDRNPELMADLVARVMTASSFQTRDREAAPLAARLANVLPGLVRKGRGVYANAPSGINWIEAADHFICRQAHDMSLAQFSDFEHDHRVEDTLAALSHQTIAHLAWRFRQWYKNPQLLSAIAAPPLREIANQLLHTPTLSIRERRPFVLYSCHDVTILALLYGIGADFLADELKSDWRFWPRYGSTLTFELVRMPPNEQPSSSYLVRILLNGKPITCVNLLNHSWEGPGEFVGKGPLHMLQIQDFVECVDRLETTGGIRWNEYGVEDASAERDMSNWTG